MKLPFKSQEPEFSTKLHWVVLKYAFVNPICMPLKVIICAIDSAVIIFRTCQVFALKTLL